MPYSGYCGHNSHFAYLRKREERKKQRSAEAWERMKVDHARKRKKKLPQTTR